MEPVRRAMRPLRRQGAASPVAEKSQELIRLLGQGATRDLLAQASRLPAEPDILATFFLSRFARLLAFDCVSACAEVAAIVDEVRDRLGRDLR